MFNSHPVDATVDMFQDKNNCNGFLSCYEKHIVH